MILLIDRLPLFRRGPSRSAESTQWLVPLPIVAVETVAFDRPPPRPARFYPWILDTAYTGRAHVWRSDLSLLGLDPRRPMRLAPTGTVSAYGEHVRNQLRPAGLWLFGNTFERPLPLLLLRGLEVHKPAAVSITRQDRLPMIGTRLLADAGIRTDIDFRRRTISVWLPAPWWQSALNLPRRLLPSRPIAWYEG